MSTGMECRVLQVSPGEWFYLLQRDDCPAGAWNWTEYAYCGGPSTRTRTPASTPCVTPTATRAGTSRIHWCPARRLLS